MATTSSTQAAGKAAIGGRFGLRAKVAAGVVTLGCAAALAFGGLWVVTAAPSGPVTAPQAPTATLGWEQRDYARRMYLLAGDTNSTSNPTAATSAWEQRDYVRRMHSLGSVQR